MNPANLLRACLLFASGAAAVAFELAAVRQFAAVGGGTVLAAAAVTAAFLGFLALGAWGSGRVADLVSRPLALFAALACAGGVAILLAPWAADAADAVLVLAFGGGAWLRPCALFAAAALFVAVPALLLGGCLPAMTAALPNLAACRRGCGALYAANTLGSVAGALLAGLVLLEALGARATMRLAGALALAAGAAALLLARLAESAPAAQAEAAPPRPPARARALACACCAGFATLALEVLGTRLLMQFLHSSVYSFTLVLAVFLLGIAGGAALGSEAAARTRDVERLLPFLLAALGVAVAATGPAVLYVARAADLVVLRGAAPQAGLALVLLPATLLSGALFALLIGHPAKGRRVAGNVGLLTLANTAGGIAGALAAGFLLLPSLGLARGLLAAAALPIAAALAVARSKAGLAAGAAGGALALALALPVDLRALPADPGFPLLVTYREGAAASVAVMRSPAEERPALFINRTTRQGGGASFAMERKQGLLPAALHGGARHALVLGVGTGATVQGLLDAGVTSIDAVELVDGVLDVLPLFAVAGASLLVHPNVELFREDAVAFARFAGRRYDLVVGDLFFPWLDGAGALYSLEHFAAVRRLLAPGGLFCQWVPLHQLEWRDFGLLARTFARAFPQTWIFLAEARAPFPVIGLVGSAEMPRLRPDAYDEMFKRARAAAAFREANLVEAGDLLELYLGDQYTIGAAFAGPKALGEENLVNTIDRPLLEFRAARSRETEDTLAVANFNNIAQHLGGALLTYLDFPASLQQEERQKYEVKLNRRSSALVQYLFGHYWRLRGLVDPVDAQGMEQFEAAKYLAGLSMFPRHPALNEAAAELCGRVFAARRYSEAAAFAAQALRFAPENAALSLRLGTAQLLLGDVKPAVEVLKHSVEVGGDDPLNLTLLGVAQYLDRDDEGARAALGAARERGGQGISLLTEAILAALDGDPERAAAIIGPLTGHAELGGLARRVLARFQEQLPVRAEKDP